MNLKIHKGNSLLFLTFTFLILAYSLISVPLVFSDPPPILDVEGYIFETDGITPIQIQVNVSLENLNSSMFVEGVTSSDSPSKFKVSIGGSTGDFAILRVWNREYQNNKTIILGMIRNESITLNMDLLLNYAPEFYSIPITSTYEDELYSYFFSVEDYNQDSLILSLENKPENMSLDLNEKKLIWTPNQNDVTASPYEISIKVSDGTYTTYQNFSLTVLNINNPPEITSYPVISGKELSPYDYFVNVSDKDEDTITYSFLLGPSSMYFSQNRLLWNPNENDSGKHLVKISVSDYSYTVYQEFVLWISPSDNNNPVITSTPSLYSKPNETYTYSISAYDVDLDFLSYELLESPEDSYIIDNNVYWVPSSDYLGNKTLFVVRVLDNKKGTDVQSFYVNTLSEIPLVQIGNSVSENQTLIRSNSGTLSVVSNVSISKPSLFKDGVLYDFFGRDIYKVYIQFSKNLSEYPSLRLTEYTQRPFGVSTPLNIIKSYFELFLENNFSVRSVDIDFKISPDYLDFANLSKDNIILLSYRNGSWIETETVYVSFSENESFFKAKTDFLTYYAISAINFTVLYETKKYIESPIFNVSFMNLSGIFYSKDNKTQVDSLTRYLILNNRTKSIYTGFTGMKNKRNTGYFSNLVEALEGDSLLITIYSDSFNETYETSVRVQDENFMYLNIYTTLSRTTLFTKIVNKGGFYFLFTFVLLIIVLSLLFRIFRKKFRKQLS